MALVFSAASYLGALLCNLPVCASLESSGNSDGIRASALRECRDGSHADSVWGRKYNAERTLENNRVDFAFL